MVIKYNSEIDTAAIIKNLDRLTNQIFKLLPNREEGGDWRTPLENIILELAGMDKLLLDHVTLFSLLCKLEALLDLDKEEDFLLFRKTIFECLGMLNGVKKCLD
jgi:hypothetical protein